MVIHHFLRLIDSFQTHLTFTNTRIIYRNHWINTAILYMSNYWQANCDTEIHPDHFTPKRVLINIGKVGISERWVMKALLIEVKSDVGYLVDG